MLGVCFFLILSFVRVSPSPTYKENKAFAECNATNPVQRNPYELITKGIIAADISYLALTKEEKCNLYCYLQKVKYFDEKGNMRSQGIVNYTIHSSALQKYGDVIIALEFQVERSTKGIKDKCEKAFISFIRYADGIFTLAMADGLERSTSVREKIMDNLKHGIEMDHELTEQIQTFLQHMDERLEHEYH